MVVVQYYIGNERVGMLLWTGYEGRLQARGGPLQGNAGQATETLVITPDGERTLEGYVHPDDLAEVSGQDGPNVRSYRNWALVWGNGNLMTEAGQVGSYRTEQEAEREADRYNRECDNPAVGYWVRREE